MIGMDLLDDEGKARILGIWKDMSESDKAHFINQVALGLSIWGGDEKGKRLVVEILGLMIDGGSQTLADFGLYVEKASDLQGYKPIGKKIDRAALIIEGYRLKNGLPSIPHKELEL